MRKILIVDDAPINRELLKIIFEEDFDIIEAGNGVEAIEKLDEYKDELCLIFLDLIMPEKSGIDVLSARNAGIVISISSFCGLPSRSSMISCVTGSILSRSSLIL